MTSDLLAYCRKAGIDLDGKRVATNPDGLPSDISESDFQSKVMALAKDNGWLAFHNFDARRSEAGFPDTHLLRKSEQVVAELKTAKGKLSGPQKRFINAYRRAGVEAYVWRPGDWKTIVERLSR